MFVADPRIVVAPTKTMVAFDACRIEGDNAGGFGRSEIPPTAIR